MNTYIMPEPVEDVLYDKDNTRWTKDDYGEWYSDTGSAVIDFGSLLQYKGQMTSEPTYNVGDHITFKEIFSLPPNSVVKAPNLLAITRCYGSVTDGISRWYDSSEYTYPDNYYTILCIGEPK